MFTVHYTFVTVLSSGASDLETERENFAIVKNSVFEESLWRLVSDTVKDRRPSSSKMSYKKYQVEFQKLREIHKILLVLYCADVW